MMQPSDFLLHFLMQPGMENVVFKSYQDSNGIWTNGMGHTLGVTPGQVVDLAQVMSWARSDMAMAAGEVNHLLAAPITAGKVAQNEFDAFTSLGFNIGNGNLAKASAISLYLQGDKLTAAQHFLLWDKDAKKQVLEGLLKRRKCEALMLLGQPWKYSIFADESDPLTSTAALTKLMAAYA